MWGAAYLCDRRSGRGRLKMGRGLEIEVCNQEEKKLGEVMEVEKLIGLIYWKVHWEPRLICFFLLILRLWQIICSSEKFLLIENWSFLIQDSLPSPLDNTRNISRVFLPTANVLSCFVCHQFIASLCNRECFPVFFFNGKDGIECSLEFLYINISLRSALFGLHHEGLLLKEWMEQ